MELEKAIERIELQLKAVWWDNLLSSCWMISLFMVVIAALTKSLMLCVFAIIFFGFSYPLIQILEHIQLNKTRRLYKNGNN